MSLGDSIRRGTKWLFMGQLGTQVVQFAFGIILARLLVPEDFGLLVTTQMVTGFASFIAGGGMGQALIQSKDVTERDFKVVFTAQLFICVLIYSFFFMIAPWFARLFDNPVYEPLLRISALTFLLRPFSNIPGAKLQRAMRFRETVTYNFVGMVIGGLTSIAMAYYGMGVYSLVLGGMVGTIFYIIGLRIKTDWKPEIILDKVILRKMGGYGVKFSINDILSFLKAQTSSFFVTKFLGPSHLGLYNKADSLSNLPRQLIMGSVYQAVFRGLSTVQDNKDLSRYMYFRTITLITVYTMPFYVALWWLAEPFISFVYGSKWLEAALPLQILSLTGLLMVGHPSGALIAAQNRLGREIFMNIETWIVLAVACWVGLHWGIVGVAWSMVFSRLYNNLRIFMIARKCVDGTFKELFLALSPAYMFNVILFVFMFGINYILPAELRVANPAIYMLVMGGSSVLIYLFLFLFMPNERLESEVARWKNLISRFLPVKGHFNS